MEWIFSIMLLGLRCFIYLIISSTFIRIKWEALCHNINNKNINNFKPLHKFWIIIWNFNKSKYERQNPYSHKKPLIFQKQRKSIIGQYHIRTENKTFIFQGKEGISCWSKSIAYRNNSMLHVKLLKKKMEKQIKLLIAYNKNDYIYFIFIILLHTHFFCPWLWLLHFVFQKLFLLLLPRHRWLHLSYSLQEMRMIMFRKKKVIYTFMFIYIYLHHTYIMYYVLNRDRYIFLYIMYNFFFISNFIKYV